MAEVLITLGIIGIVAALTIPSLIAKHQEKETITRLKKVYSILSQAYQLAENEYGKASTWYDRGEGIGKNKRLVFLDTLGEFLKVDKNCKYSAEGCFPDIAYSCPTSAPDCDWNIENDNTNHKMRLTDGTLITLATESVRCEKSYSKDGADNPHLKNVCAWIVVDVNGFKKPNKLGNDTFEFYLTNYGIFPVGTKEEGGENSLTFDVCPLYGQGCTSWALQNENLDYLRCPDELGWDKAAKCSK